MDVLSRVSALAARILEYVDSQESFSDSELRCETVTTNTMAAQTHRPKKKKVKKVKSSVKEEATCFNQENHTLSDKTNAKLPSKDSNNLKPELDACLKRSFSMERLSEERLAENLQCEQNMIIPNKKRPISSSSGDPPIKSIDTTTSIRRAGTKTSIKRTDAKASIKGTNTKAATSVEPRMETEFNKVGICSQHVIRNTHPGGSILRSSLRSSEKTNQPRKTLSRPQTAPVKRRPVSIQNKNGCEAAYSKCAIVTPTATPMSVLSSTGQNNEPPTQPTSAARGPLNTSKTTGCKTECSKHSNVAPTATPMSVLSSVSHNNAPPTQPTSAEQGPATISNTIGCEAANSNHTNMTLAATPMSILSSIGQRNPPPTQPPRIIMANPRPSPSQNVIAPRRRSNDTPTTELRQISLRRRETLVGRVATQLHHRIRTSSLLDSPAVSDDYLNNLIHRHAPSLRHVVSQRSAFISLDSWSAFAHQTTSETKNTGLSETQLLSLTGFHSVETFEDPCCICLDEVQTGDLALMLSCSHAYHDKCIKKWLASTPQCPLCKTEVIP